MTRKRIAVLSAFTLPLFAIPPIDEEVPIARLLRNVSAYAQAHPQEAEAHYLLGRLHASAFLFGVNKPLPVAALKKVGGRYVYSDEKASPERPVLLHRGPSLRSRELKELAPEDVAEFRAAVQEYQRALALGSNEPVSYPWFQAAPNRAFSYLGLAWIIEQADQYAAQLGPPPDVDNVKAKSNTAEQWREQALAAYRRCYDSAGNQESGDPNGRLAPRFECGDAIVRLLKAKVPAQPPSLLERLLGRDPYAGERKELARMEKAMRGPRTISISPIILSLQGQAGLQSLLDRSVSVPFDLDGSGQRRRWPWVGPHTGILVWDPEPTGRITSGRQLFGSVTWWLFWANGYQPVAALDDDGDGWLAGSELRGLAIWQDRNQNGISEPGEVTTADTAGIQRISVHPQGSQEGTWFHAVGVEFRDGTTAPTYDWIPTELR